MNDTDSNELSANIVNDFVARRYAQIYADKFTKESKEIAEAWVRERVATEDRKVLQQYVIEELKKRGFTNIRPGGIK